MSKLRKKSKKSPLPAIDLEFKIALCEDGSIAIAYSGTDDRTFATGDAIVEAICQAYGFTAEQVFQGAVRA
jgi:hypothetical protein